MRSLLFAALFTATGSAFALGCGDELVRDTVLTADLDCHDAAVALTIARSGVTLDLNGHTIRGGDRTNAIELEDVRNVTIRNGRIVDAGTGVEATRTKGLSVARVELVDVGDGVRLVNSSRAEIANNRFDGVVGHAVAVLALPYALTRGGSHSIHDNVVTNSEYGVLLHGRGSAHTLVARNRFDGIGTFAIQAGHTSNRIQDNEYGEFGGEDAVY